MTEQQKGQMITAIISHLKFAARAENRAFDAGDMFFAMAFRTDEELMKIAKLAGC